MSAKEKFILYCVMLFFIVIGLISVFFNANGFYSGAYSKVARPAYEDEQRYERKSNEPRPAGMRESDIDKKQGHRYRTY